MIQSKINDIDKALEILHAPGKSILKLWEVHHQGFMDSQTVFAFASMCIKFCTPNSESGLSLVDNYLVVWRHRIDSESVPYLKMDLEYMLINESSCRATGYAQFKAQTDTDSAVNKELRRQIDWLISLFEYRKKCLEDLLEFGKTKENLNVE